MAKFEYHLLQDVKSYNEASMASRLSEKKLTVATSLALVTSIAINTLLLLQIHHIHEHPPFGSTCRSLYAGLVNDVELPLHWDSARNDPDDEARNKLWYEDEEGDKGIIAMSNEEAKAHAGLPESQPFPWAPLKKSIYITNGHHNLHCIRNLYIAIDQYSRGVPQTLERPHVLHCLGALYDDIKCNADDTPRYTVKNGLRPGENQLRKCRDWTKLQKYVSDREGCFKYIFHNVHNISQIERMKYCSNDSPYIPHIRQYFGYGDDWNPWPYVQQEQFLTQDDAP